MKLESKRLFISDLPLGFTDEDLAKKFSKYGTITATEIKERKNFGPKNTSPFFAYINIEISEANLQKCFEDITNNEWKGNFVNVQIAKESFLERLKRERESRGTDAGKNVISETKTNGFAANDIKEIPKISNSFHNQKAKSSSESSSESEDESEAQPLAKQKKIEFKPNKSKALIENEHNSKFYTEIADEPIEIDPDIVIKNNKNVRLDDKKLKIESLGFKPIVKIEPKKPKSKDPSRTAADNKRIQSMLDMRKGFQQQKSLLKSALANVDRKPKNKIIFDEYEEIENDKVDETEIQNKNKSLFEDDDEDEENEDINFELKEQFEGEKGQKLLQLQSRFKNDKRFAMDSRFLEDFEAETRENQDIHENHNEIDEENLTLEQEKQKEFEILEQVLGKRVAPKEKLPENQKPKTMLRFDPTQPEHSKYEVKQSTETFEKKKRKRKESEAKTEEEKPEVSKETFYKVTENLKDVLEEKQSFSLLNMFGNDVEKEREENISEALPLPSTKDTGLNPFRYDSSDDEEAKTTEKRDEKKDEKKEKKQTARAYFGESFFFKEDDFRLQEGEDFVMKIGTEEKSGFRETRRDLRMIVRKKVRHNDRKTRMFKTKLGGNPRTRLKIKKALKR